MVLYNISQVANSSGVLEFVQNVNSLLMDNWYGTLILIAIFGILLIAFLTKTNNARIAFAASSFICFGLSIFLRTLELVPSKTLFIFLSMAAFSVAVLKAG